MSIEKILKVFPVPVQRNIVIGDWQEIENKIGRILPMDYKMLVEKYGTFSIDSFLWIYNPFTQNRNLNLIKKSSFIVEILKDMMTDHRDCVPYDYPATCDLVPWSTTDNGDDLYWLIHKESNKWKIVVNETRSFNWQEFDLTTTEFLYKLLTKEIKVEAFPDSFPSDNPQFNFIQ